MRFLLTNNPEAVAIFRNHATEWGYAGKNAPVQGAATADQWWAETRGVLEQIPLALRSRVYVKGVNEPGDPHLQADALNAFEMRRMDILGGQGFKAALFAFSPGVPDITDGNDQWPLFYPALERANREGHLLALHEYHHYAPDESPAVTVAGREAGWLVLRYRMVLDKHIRPCGWHNLRIGLGEVGRGGNPAGWRHIMDAAAYIAQLKWMDDRWREDAEVLGGAVFLHGLYGPGDQWSGFDIGGDAARLMYDYVASLD